MHRQKSNYEQAHREKSHMDKRAKNKGKNVHNVATSGNGSTSDSDTPELGHLELHSITEEEDRQIIWISPDVSGRKVKMELDTDSALSVISQMDHIRLFPNLPLLKTSVGLKTYIGENVRPKGKLKVTVTYRGELMLYVVKRG